MNIGTFFTLYAISIPVFVVLDLLWLGVIAKGFYQSRLGYLLGDVNWYAAIIFYLVFLAGLTFFVTLPSLESNFLRTALIGCFFGLVTYATYDLTNHATIAGWPLGITLVDIVWGAVLGAVVASVARAAYLFIV